MPNEIYNESELEFLAAAPPRHEIQTFEEELKDSIVPIQTSRQYSSPTAKRTAETVDGIATQDM